MRASGSRPSPPSSCLIANGVPTPYGSIGIPTVSLAGLVGLDAARLASVQMLQLAPFFIAAPFLIVLVAGSGSDGRTTVAERLRGVAGIALASGVSFAAASFVVATFVGPELAVVVGSICSLGLTALLGRRAAASGRLDARFHAACSEEPLTARRALAS